MLACKYGSRWDTSKTLWKDGILPLVWVPVGLRGWSFISMLAYFHAGVKGWFLVGMLVIQLAAMLTCKYAGMYPCRYADITACQLTPLAAYWAAWGQGLQVGEFTLQEDKLPER